MGLRFVWLKAIVEIFNFVRWGIAGLDCKQRATILKLPHPITGNSTFRAGFAGK
jgi:hypothetical protein